MKRNISNDLSLRIKGWRAALRSPKLPPWLKPSIRRSIARAEKRMRRKRS